MDDNEIQQICRKNGVKVDEDMALPVQDSFEAVGR